MSENAAARIDAQRDLLEKAGDAVWHQVRERDQHDAVDRPGGGLRYLISEVRHELNEYGPVHRARDGRDAPDDDPDEQADRQEHRETVRSDELHGQRTERARDARVHGADPERDRLVHGDVDAERGSGDMAIA